MTHPEADDQTALRIGRIVLSCARLEQEIKWLAMNVGEPDAQKLSQDKQLKAIRRRTRMHSTANEFSAWTFEVDAVLKSRAELVHGSFMGIWEGDGERRGFVPHRGIAEVDIDNARLEAIAVRADKATEQGMKFSQAFYRDRAKTTIFFDANG